MSITGFQTLEHNMFERVGYGKGYRIIEEQKGTQVTSYEWNKKEIRLPHPVNMQHYEKWSVDPEASVALTVLSNIIAGVGYYTEMDTEYQPQKGGEKPHPNKALVDKYGEATNLDEDLQTITEMMLAKGICPVEIAESHDSQYDLNILPAESFYKYIDKKNHIIKYTQERSQSDIIAEWKTPEEIASIIPFMFRWSPTPLQETINRHYGRSLLEPIGDLLDSRADMNVDMPKAVHRWAYPIPIMETSGAKADLQSACENRDIDDWIFIGNVQEGEVRWKTLEIDPQARFIPYIELIYYQICEGLHAPLLLYLKNATEASATVMMESVDRLVNGIQRYIKRRVEHYLFKPQTGDPVPRLVWGQPKTGLEDVTLTDVASIINSPKVANNQVQWILKQYWSSIPEPDWKLEAEISKQKSPFPQQPFGQQPFQKKPQGQEIPVEKALEALNDINTNLGIIEANFREGKIPITQACRFAERVIQVHMRKAYPHEWETKTSEMFQKFVQECLLKVGKPSYRVTVD